jgi:DNA-binding MarR family transcriptional regulator
LVSFLLGIVADWRRDFAEEMGGLVLVEGTPRAVMRVLGWMVVCQPREQSAADIQEELELSAGSVSAAVRTLGELGVLEHVARPGDRRTYHRLREHGWERLLEMHFRVLGEMRRLAGCAIEAAAGHTDERLLEMSDTYTLMEDGVTYLLRESRFRRSDRPVAGTTPLAANA